MCQKLMKHKQLFEDEFLDIFVGLKDDKVPNVKLALAEIVRKHMEEKGPLSQHEKFLQLYESLKKDTDEEISSVFEV